MREARVLLLAVAPLLAAAADSPRPRGVGPDFAKYYKSKDTFTCISNPSISIPFAQVNDDYCDCPDGSDEPGTAACAYIHPYSYKLASDQIPGTENQTAALPGFYCKNKGHMPGYIPFTRVNDGACDYDLCCDGSEEFAGVGGVKCPDKCKEIGKEWRRLDDVRQKTLTAAGKRRKELLAEASRLRKQIEDAIKDRQAELQGAEVKLVEARKILEETETAERSKLARGGGKTGKVGQLAGLARERVEELRTSLQYVKTQRDEHVNRMKELEQVLSTFKEEYNPNFNDEGVKRAVRAWEDYAARDKASIDENSATERDLEEILKEDSSAQGINWSEWENADGEEDDVEQLYTLTAYLPPFVRTWVDSKLHELKEFLVSNGVIAAGTAAGDIGDSDAVKNARAGVSQAENQVNNVKRTIEDNNNDLQKDYGPDDIFRALKGQTSSKDSGEYTYEVVWLERTSQKSKKGGSSTNMGNFAGFTIVTVDDELPADGKGLGSGERLAMKFDAGQHCWNGPSRSTLVVMGCSEQEEVWKISEEEKCVYRMEVGTAAVCGVDPAKVAEEAQVKDEL